MESSEERATFRAACELFDAGRYLAAHELFEELWEATSGPEEDFFKGLLQATVALHHFESGNLEGAARLHGGHRRYLAAYLPEHRGVDVSGLLADMQRFLGPVVERGPDEEPTFVAEQRPRIGRSAERDTSSA